MSTDHSLDTTPAGLLKAITRFQRAVDDYSTNDDLREYLDEAVKLLSALATSSPPAPQEIDSDEKDGIIRGLVDALHGRVTPLEEIRARNVAPAVPDHAGLVKEIRGWVNARWATLAQRRKSTDDVEARNRLRVRQEEIERVDDYLQNLRPTGGETQ